MFESITDVLPLSAETFAAEETEAERQEAQEREAFLHEVDADLAGPADLSDPTHLDVYLDHLGERLREREEEIARNSEIAQRRIAMVQAWERDANGRIQRESQWLRQQIEAFARGYDFGGKRKSRALPNLTFGYRAQPAKLEIVDQAAALSFAKAEGLPIKETVQVTPLKEYMKTSGILPDGCEYVEGSESFYIKTGG